MGARRHDLLGQNVNRPRRDGQRIQIAVFDGPGQGNALGQLVSGQREKPALGRAADLVAGASHALQQDPDGAGRANLADQIDNTDVDTEFQGRRGDAYLDLPAFQFLFRGQPCGAGEATVVGHDGIVTQARR